MTLEASKEEKYKYAIVEVGSMGFCEGQKPWGGYGKTGQCEHLASHRAFEV